VDLRSSFDSRGTCSKAFQQLVKQEFMRSSVDLRSSFDSRGMCSKACQQLVKQEFMRSSVDLRSSFDSRGTCSKACQQLVKQEVILYLLYFTDFTYSALLEYAEALHRPCSPKLLVYEALRY
jgi:hypothetical protein